MIDGPDGPDATLRPNQLFAVSLPIDVLDEARRRAIVEVCASRLWTPAGLRSLDPHDPRYAGRYGGDQRARDGAYHQGTVWTWLAGPFALAHARVYGDAAASTALLDTCASGLTADAIGTLAEIADGDPPFAARGAFAQAWSVATLLDAWFQLAAPSAAEAIWPLRANRRVMATLGWIGLGEIGTPMALRLIGAGYRVVVWGRTASRLQPVVESGATAAASPADVASQCDAVILCVTDGDAVEDVVFGPRGIAEGARRGSLIVDHSTIHPETARLASRRLRSAGVGWVDAPVSGGAAGAEAGTLSIFLGGEDGDVERVRPWIAAYAANVTHMGGVGSGQVAKSCNQAIVASTIGIWAEVIAYARRCGVDPDQLVDALEGGWADSAIRRAHARDMVAGRFRRTPGLIILKDLDIIGDMARATTSPMPVTSAVTTLYRLLLTQGHETGSLGALMQLYDAKSADRTETPH